MTRIPAPGRLTHDMGTFVHAIDEHPDSGGPTTEVRDVPHVGIVTWVQTEGGGWNILWCEAKGQEYG